MGHEDSSVGLKQTGGWMEAAAQVWKGHLGVVDASRLLERGLPEFLDSRAHICDRLWFQPPPFLRKTFNLRFRFDEKET